MLQVLKSSAEGLMAVLNDVLDLSKIEARHMRIERIPFSIAECVNSAVLTLFAPAQSKGLALTCNLSQDIPALVLGDPERVRQILLNLIGNAIKFTPMGYVHVGARREWRCPGSQWRQRHRHHSRTAKAMLNPFIRPTSRQPEHGGDGLTACRLSPNW